MRNPAATPSLAHVPRGLRARPTRFAAPALVALGSRAALAPSGPRACELLRKSPAWIDRDL
jgi:hypothetical protein